MVVHAVRVALPAVLVLAAACSAPSIPEADAGMPPVVDAGARPIDAGSADAGPADAGAIAADAGALPECLTDLQCPNTRFCTASACVPRPVQFDGGFPCLQACDCRMGEWCAASTCVPDPIVPTFFLSSGASGDGRTPMHPSGNLAALVAGADAGETFAVQALSTFDLVRPVELRAAATSLVGGYIACSASRWVRDPFTRSSLRTDGGVLVRVVDAGEVRIDGLDLWPGPTCSGGQLEVTNAPDFRASRVRGRFVGPGDAGCGQGAPSVVVCTGCVDAGFEDMALGASEPLRDIAASAILRLKDSSGDVRSTTMELQSGTLAALTLVDVESNVGPIRVHDTALPFVDAKQVTGISAKSCGAPVLIEHNALEWPLQAFTGISAEECADVSVLDNRIIQTWAGSPSAVGEAVLLLGSTGGRISGNILIGPAGIGVSSQFSVLGLEIRDNQIRTSPWEAVYVTIGARAAVAFEGNTVFSNTSSYAVHLHPWPLVGSFESRRWWVADNRIENTGYGGAELLGGTFRIERNHVRGSTIGVRFFGAGTAELISNEIAATRAVFVDAPVDLTLRGNTISARQTAILCGYPFPTKLSAHGNIFALEGTDPLSTFLRDQGSACSDPAAWRSNYLSGLPAFDDFQKVVKADAGTRDSNNNLYNFAVSCFADAGTYRLAAGSPCVDTGEFLYDADGGLIEFDIDGLSRLDAGLPDIGASELH